MSVMGLLFPATTLLVFNLADDAAGYYLPDTSWGESQQTVLLDGNLCRISRELAAN